MPRDKTFTEKSSIAKRQQKSQDRQGFTAGEGRQIHDIHSQQQHSSDVTTSEKQLRN